MRWLFLVHQVHTPSSKERVKVWRAIKKIGAVLYRNSVYVLPYSKERMEDFQWVCQQIKDAQGEASVFVSRTSGPAKDQALRALFKKARDDGYTKVQMAAEKLQRRIDLARKGKRLTDRLQKELEKEAKQLREAFEDAKKIDFFVGIPPRKISQLIEEISRTLALSPRIPAAPLPKYSVKDFRKKVWTTREGIHIDRLCTAWLIRRFIDPEARFVFAPESSLPRHAIPFDVFGAEFSHRGEDCTFETLLKAFRLRDPGLRSIAEIIHDVDLKDHKFSRSEASGIDTVIRSLADSLKDDHQLLEMGSAILDALYRLYSK